MIPGIYISAGGMIASEQRQSVYANNVANSSTAGYKALTPVQLGFYPLFRKVGENYHVYVPKSAPGGGVKVVETFPDLSLGPLKQTGNPLNIAIQGPGYFVLQTPSGERFTRAGDLTLDSGGYLSTPQGYQVLGTNGQPIQIQGTEINISTDGNITVDGVPAGQIRCVEFTSPERLKREGENLYSASPEIQRGMKPASRSALRQGYLEWSNTKIPTEMVRLTLGLRAYEANQRVISAIDESIGRLIDQVGLAG